ncbi:unnamed protein product [Arabis nemorensis]|uniref:THIF-type NAD/FAD binding fold domain-containing protein n=1 Tax=Arabis nemorensis TaxID=586526 RepID=A0A565AUJ9_9BRAS|nr:unnamed protein product [Arabis nemorensis]
MDGEELTEQETALYDRQIRVWGPNGQRRLTKSHIFVSGIKGTVAEFCKNIVLAGVGSVTLMDDGLVNEDTLNANFLIPPDDNAYMGKTVAEVCSDSLKEFNPMVLVSVAKGDLSTLGAEFFEKFDVVVIGYSSRATKKAVNEKWRKLSKQVAFYTVDCRNSCAEIFVDLQNYKYTKKTLEETLEYELHFPSFHEAITIPWKLIPRRTSKLYFAMRVIEVFEETEGRKPGECSLLDLARVLEISKKLFMANSVSESNILDSVLERLITDTTEFPPACAIVGGILAQVLSRFLFAFNLLLMGNLVIFTREILVSQEVIKAISRKGEPLKNFFYFDAQDGKGMIEDIANYSK